MPAARQRSRSPSIALAVSAKMGTRRAGVPAGRAAFDIASCSRIAALAAIELAEALATSDVPGGVVNLLTGRKEELAPVLAGHMDVNALDVTGANGEVAELEQLAA